MSDAADRADLAPTIRTFHTHIPSPLPTAPSFVFQLTLLQDTLFVWVGAGAPTVATATLQNASAGSSSSGPSALMLDDREEAAAVGIGEKRLAGEWGVSMPARANMPVTSTPIFRAGSSDLALPMSLRLARKFPPRQIHLSLSLPPSLTVQTGPSLDPLSSKTLLIMEKELGKWLGQVLDAAGGL